jgi:hypothetical protein
VLHKRYVVRVSPDGIRNAQRRGNPFYVNALRTGDQTRDFATCLMRGLSLGRGDHSSRSRSSFKLLRKNLIAVARGIPPSMSSSAVCVASCSSVMSCNSAFGSRSGISDVDQKPHRPGTVIASQALHLAVGTALTGRVRHKPFLPGRRRARRLCQPPSLSVSRAIRTWKCGTAAKPEPPDRRRSKEIYWHKSGGFVPVRRAKLPAEARRTTGSVADMPLPAARTVLIAR